jgi:hypothetical protein
MEGTRNGDVRGIVIGIISGLITTAIVGSITPARHLLTNPSQLRQAIIIESIVFVVSVAVTIVMLFLSNTERAFEIIMDIGVVISSILMVLFFVLVIARIIVVYAR